MTIEFDKKDFEMEIGSLTVYQTWIDSHKLLDFVEQLVKAHNELFQKVEELIESAGKQAIEIAELRANINELMSRPRLNKEVAKAATNAIQYEDKYSKMLLAQLKEDIRAFFNALYKRSGPLHARDINNPWTRIIDYIQDLEEFKNLKRHCDE